METFENALQPGTLLGEQYRIESVLGEGGFGITYKAHDEKLDCAVAVKEFLPSELAVRAGDSLSIQARTNRTEDYQFGIQRFLEEARTLAKFRHSNIVHVNNFLEANGTAYIIMGFEEGIELGEWLKKKNDVLEEKTILQIITPILKGLAEVHKAGIMHRDIKPGNIFLRKEGGPMLIDFGAARQAMGEHSKSISAIISMGYAPPEQYTTRGKQGAYTDLYAVGAVAYKLITGEAPIESVDRSHEIMGGEDDPLTPAIEAGKGKVADWLLQIVDQLLIINPKNRPQSAEAVLEAIKNKTTADVGADSSAQPSSKQSDNKTRVVKSGDRFGNKANQTKPDTTQNSKSKTPLIVAAAVVIAVIGVGGWWFSQSDGSNVAANVPVETKKLAKGNAILYVESSPEGAEIYLDNILLGQTPYKNQQLSNGAHELKLQHKDSEDQLDSITLADNEITKKQYQLKPASGNISVFSTPEGASIHIDGSDTGKQTPATLKGISAGEHQLKLTLERYYSKQTTISISKNKTGREDLTLEGGHLVEYKGEWLEPEEKEQRVAEAKRIAEQKAADAKEAKRIAEKKAREQKAADYRQQASAKAQHGDVVEVKNLLAKAAKLVGDKAGDKQILATAKQQQQRIERLVGKMIAIPAGSFQMGSNNGDSDEKPIHRVSLKAFKLGQHEVTQKQWQAVMGNKPSNFSGCDDCPVEKVSWNDIQGFLKKLNQQTGQAFRLPSEAEWEYAARAGSTSNSPSGSHANGGEENGWPSDGYNKKTAPVGSFKANAFGLYDMTGNVWEWTQDCWNGSYSGSPANGEAWQSGDCAKRVLRGGSWSSHPYNLRSASRHNRGTAAARSNTDGFRLAQD